MKTTPTPGTDTISSMFSTPSAVSIWMMASSSPSASSGHTSARCI